MRKRNPGFRHDVAIAVVDQEEPFLTGGFQLTRNLVIKDIDRFRHIECEIAEIDFHHLKVGMERNTILEDFISHRKIPQ